MTQSITFLTGQAVQTDTSFYKIIKPIGSGKNADAYYCLRTSNHNKGNFYVIKISKWPHDKRKLQLFGREIDTLKRLNHPSVIKIDDSGIFNSRKEHCSYPFYVTEFQSDTLAHKYGCSISDKVGYAIQLCAALIYLKESNVIHCDIKPNNIYVNGPKIVLADFGLSSHGQNVLDKSELPSLHNYRSPDIVEAIKNNTPITCKSDTFQLGLTLHELFFGENPCELSSSGTDPVILKNFPTPSEHYNWRIFKLVNMMIHLNPEKRLDISKIHDLWQGILFDMVKQNKF